MNVSREEIEHIARLAALGIDEQSLPALTDQIRRILDYVSQLENVEQSEQEATSTSPGPRQPLRDDEPHRSPLAVPLAEIAPLFRDGLFLLPRLGAVGAGDTLATEDEE